MLRCEDDDAQGIPLRLCFKVTESVKESCIEVADLRASSHMAARERMPREPEVLPGRLER